MGTGPGGSPRPPAPIPAPAVLRNAGAQSPSVSFTKSRLCLSPAVLRAPSEEDAERDTVLLPSLVPAAFKPSYPEMRREWGALHPEAEPCRVQGPSTQLPVYLMNHIHPRAWNRGFAGIHSPYSPCE